MTHLLDPNKPLTVYKASAGSGKTFRLAVEYIKLLLINPRAYEGILAVTFTNKATEEMKMRILSQLYGIWKSLPQSAAYVSEVTTSLGLTKEAAAERAGKALHQLLHNYHFFKVQTIDTFFQNVLRNLANELQLNANLRVGLNNQQVVEQAVDALIDSLAEDKKLMRIVMDYVSDNMQEDKVWNVIGQIKRFGGTIFSEHYKQNRARMDAVFADSSFFDKYKDTMHRIISNTERKYREYGEKALEYITAAGLNTDDFASKSRGPAGYFMKLAAGKIQDKDLMTKTFEAAMENADKWVTKTSKQKDIILPFVEEVLLPMIKEIEEGRPADTCQLNSAKVTLKHVNDVRLLRKIEETAHSLNNTAQRFMLSDTQSLLHEMIDEGDSAFIFEKIGTRLEHIMIDEFQDTSTIQWENFKPLLHECMSQRFSNLVVGDVKQSIYRFRNGDWRLLNDIDKVFSKEELDFPPMRTNWRSDRNIVCFNNTFFKIAADIEVEGIRELSEEKADSLQKAYADVEQEIPDNKKPIGLVNIEMLPKDMLDTMQERTLQTILDLIALGAEQKDIAILVRNGKEIPTLAQYIENNSDIKVISAEAFRLDASTAVRIIANAMTLLAHPNDDIALAALATDYNTLISKDVEVLDKAFSGECNLHDILPKEYTANRDTLVAMSLHDIAETTVRIFGIDKVESETAYVTAFFDSMQDFCNDSVPVLEDFINAWNEDISRSTIQAATSNGVRILTIHKSKGLEFRHVIIPYCNWSCDPPRMSLLWTQPKVRPFSDLPVIPIDYSNVNTLENTIYRADGYNEHIQNVVDNLNLLYVAMTRAGHSLFIIGERNDTKATRSKTICQVIERLPPSIDGVNIHTSGIDNEDEPLSITYGTIVEENCTEKTPMDPKKESRNVFLPDIKPCNVRLHSYSSEVEFRQSNASRRFADDTVDETDRQRMIRMGTVMHQLFSTIQTLNDIEPALQRMEFDGTLYGEGITRDTLIASLRSKFKSKQVRDWFSDRWTVYNECSIISPDGSEHRPDRVITDKDNTIVIDFKFGSPNAKHREQVNEYIQLLKAMGMPNVKGFLWYVTSEQIQDI